MPKARVSIVRKSLVRFVGVLGAAALILAACRFATPDPVVARGPGPEEWEQAPYVLARGELVRLVPPAHFRRLPPPQAVLQRESSDRVWTDDVRRDTLGSLLERWGNLDELESEFSGDVAGLRVDGDWLVRNGEPRTERIHAIVSIVGRALGRDLRVERRWDRRDAFVVSGRFVKPAPPEPSVAEDLARLAKSAMAPAWEHEGTDCHFYLWPWSGSIAAFLREVQKVAGCVVIDEASYSLMDTIVLPGITVHQPGVPRPSPIDLLSRLSLETSLNWEKTQREIAVYRIYENKADERVEPR